MCIFETCSFTAHPFDIEASNRQQWSTPGQVGLGKSTPALRAGRYHATLAVVGASVPHSAAHSIQSNAASIHTYTSHPYPSTTALRDIKTERPRRITCPTYSSINPPLTARLPSCIRCDKAKGRRTAIWTADRQLLPKYRIPEKQREPSRPNRSGNVQRASRHGPAWASAGHSSRRAPRAGARRVRDSSRQIEPART
jgi:hypothetical protein